MTKRCFFRGLIFFFAFHLLGNMFLYAKSKLLDCFASEQYLYQEGEYEEELFRYRLYSPSEITPGKKYPILLWLNASAHAGVSNTAQLTHLENVIPNVEALEEHPYFILAMQCPADNRTWHNSIATTRIEPAEALWKLVDQLLERHPIDENCISAAAVSSAATEGWEFAQRYGNRLSAMALFGGVDYPIDRFKQLVDLPIWSFQNSDDEIAPPDRVRKTIDMVNKEGGNAYMTVIHEEYAWKRESGNQVIVTAAAGKPRQNPHYTFEPAFEGYDLANWLVSQRRGVSGIPPGSCSWHYHWKTIQQRWQWWELCAQIVVLAFVPLACFHELRRRKKFRSQLTLIGLTGALSFFSCITTSHAESHAESHADIFSPEEVSATSSYHRGLGASRVIDHSGLIGPLNTVTKHAPGLKAAGMWVAGVPEAGAAAGTGTKPAEVADTHLVFHFHNPAKLEKIALWQFNQIVPAKKGFFYSDSIFATSHYENHSPSSLVDRRGLTGGSLAQAKQQPSPKAAGMWVAGVPEAGAAAGTGTKPAEVADTHLVFHFHSPAKLKKIALWQFNQIVPAKKGFFYSDSIFATSHYENHSPSSLVDRRGLTGGSLAQAKQQPSPKAAGMWVAGVPEAGAAAGTGTKPANVADTHLVFHFRSPAKLKKIALWQFNQIVPAVAGRQVANFDLYVSQQSSGEGNFTKYNTSPLKLSQVVGEAPYFGETFDLQADKVRRVKLDILSTHSGKENENVGLAEVAFAGEKNSSSLINRQVANFDLYVSQQSSGEGNFTKYNTSPLKLSQVVGETPYSGETFDLQANKVKRVKLDILSTHSGKENENVGLAEVAFAGEKRSSSLINRQIANFDLYVSQQSSGDNNFTKYNTSPLKLSQVVGETPHLCEAFELQAENVRRVKLDVLSTHSGRKNEHVGLSEVAFIGKQSYSFWGMLTIYATSVIASISAVMFAIYCYLTRIRWPAELALEAEKKDLSPPAKFE